MTLFITGCAGVQPLSSYARTGDTVMVALGGEHKRTSVAVLKKENISVNITDSASSVYPVKLRNLLKVTPDLASRMNYAGLYSGSFEFSEGAYQGMWLGIVDLIDPVTGDAPVLAVGQAELNITGDGLIATNAGSGTGDITNIPIEILPGQGTPNPLNAYSFIGNEVYPVESLEPLPQVDISPSASTDVFGGASFIVRYVGVDFNNRYPKALPSTQDPNVQMMSSYEAQGDGTILHKIFISNPNGFNPTNDHTGLSTGKSDLHSLSVRLTWGMPNTVVTDMTWQSSIELVSGEYVDINGEKLVGIVPVLTKVR